MMGWMIQQEFLNLDSSRIPQSIETVAKKILEYPEMTELTIYQGPKIIGYVRMNPQLAAAGNSHPDTIYHCLLSTDLKMPFLSRDYSLNFSARMDFDKKTRLQSFDGRGKVSDINFLFNGSSLDNQISIHYSLDPAAKPVAVNIPFNFGTDMKTLGNEIPQDYRDIAKSYGDKTSIEAYSTKTLIGDEKVLAYVIESKMDGSSLLKIWVTRFGQVYKIETSYGIELRANDVL